ncbi:Short-chain dehydrogenase/reductase SDR [Acididesulfobacillus acetoxydans]|uniref:Short-chain dehydrogenase/reductase SDR n=1 Tax=Acididesulfobacillus acetoxydans TaxID=1561005 RepID=A0A8S0W5Q0_9FIRM|nr:SDR family oxidoreductase [Acididesulfobacillus acetoxydans]CAA7603378.1 Short-chain dehydrogenase/reductase SDR [Acididesulfobacillus acetoxydans]CEJ08323.1 Short-chain dehydrogenase/reductase sdr [Acididesulfobacillus acetoxydans]
MSNRQRIVIFGATSAIASACARQWVRRGDSLFLVGRNENKLESLMANLRVQSSTGQQIEGAIADLNDFEQHEELFARAEHALGEIDVVLIAHGTLPDQQACENSVPLTMAEMRTNGLSVIALLTGAANRMEARGRGCLAVITSVAGDRGRASNYVYGAAKGMVILFLQGLRNRLAKRGVTVITIKPGFVDTPMTARFEKKGPLWAEPETVAYGIVTAVEKRRDIVYLSGMWRWIMLIIRHIPESIFKRLSL